MKNLLLLLSISILTSCATIPTPTEPQLKVSQFLQNTNTAELKIISSYKTIWSSVPQITAVVGNAQGDYVWVREHETVLYTDGKKNKNPYDFKSKVRVLMLFEHLGYEVKQFESSAPDAYGQGVVTYLLSKK
jgi:hypothetical protein